MSNKNYITYIVFKEVAVKMNPINFASMNYNEIGLDTTKIQTKYKLRRVVKETSNSFLIKNNKKFQHIEKSNVYQIIRLPN